MRKTLSIMLTCLLVIGTLLSASTVQVQATTQGWNSERYGDVLDVGTYLRHLDSDATFAAEAANKIKGSAAKINFDEEPISDSTTSDSNFTFDGGTKFFLNRDLDFKEFTLRSVGQNIEVWVANDLSFPEGDSRPAHVITQEQVDRMRDTFDSTIYPKDTEFFGTPDSHDGSNSALAKSGYVPKGYYEGSNKIIMLVDNIIDESYYDPTYPFFVAGFFWGTLENYIDRNIITIDSRDWDVRLESTFFGTTAHEFQHLIHADNDSMEETWINEGMADFAEYLCFNEHPMGHINFFLDHPENSLVEWDDHYSATTGPETLADYGQAYLLQLYLNDKFGKDFVRALAVDGDQGIVSVNKILNQFNIGIDFEELFRRFSIAAAIDNPQPENGIYNFDSIDLNVNFESALTFDKDGVPAWGADYKEILNANKIQDIKIDGIEFLPSPWQVVDKDGEKVFWGNQGDEKANQLILKADLSNVSTATLKFDNFIDIEEQWDFGIVQVSTDNGTTWTSLANENTRSDLVDEGHPAIKANLPGFTGYYEDWKNEVFDLTPFAGRQILINFNYMTDWGYNDTGWYIDNIEIPEIGYSTDCSTLDGFCGIDEIKGNYVEYSLVFINQKSMGRGNNQSHYRVLNIDPMNISEAEAITLKGFFSGGNNYMIVWYAAPVGNKGTVDFTYEITTKNEHAKKGHGGKGGMNGNGHGNGNGMGNKNK